MNYVDEHGMRRHIYESGAKRLRLVAEKAPLGRQQTPTPWPVSAVRNGEDQGWWTVDWLEPGDDNREHAWRINGLTAKGRNLLAEWDRRVVQGAGERGTKRANRGES
jgi:hypothetical protein